MHPYQNLLEQRTGYKFKLKTIETQGDQITDRRFVAIRWQGFLYQGIRCGFIKNEVDLVVHSYKDLGSQRPRASS